MILPCGAIYKAAEILQADASITLSRLTEPVLERIVAEKSFMVDVSSPR